MQVGIWRQMYCVLSTYVKKFQIICIPQLNSKQKVMFLIWFKQYLSQWSTGCLTLMKMQKNLSSRTLHLALQPTDSAPKSVLWSSLTSQIKINPSKQCQKKTCAAYRDAGCKQRDSCKGSGHRKWCTWVVTGLHGELKR